LACRAVAGDEPGTFVFIWPLPWFKVLDEGVSRSAAAYLRSTGTPSSRAGTAGRPGIELSHENLLFRIEPRLSFVSEDFAGVAPDFWQTARRGR